MIFYMELRMIEFNIIDLYLRVWKCIEYNVFLTTIIGMILQNI